MSETLFISTDRLGELVSEILAAGTRVIAPVRTDAGQVAYSSIGSLAEATFNEGLAMPALKAHFLPPSEALLSWRQRGGDIEMRAASTTFAPQLVLGARPCDVDAVRVLDAIMNWDYADELWNGRREATTILAMACPSIDADCFCSAVGSGPDSTKGADGILVPVDGGYLVEFVTEKGAALEAAHSGFFAPASSDAVAQADTFRRSARERVEGNLSIDTERIAVWIDGHFDDALWPSLGPRCNGCGACACVCPTCHCFDINDEQCGVGAGVRRRNWDSCQSGRFTVHASGHNPRGDQNARHRQRVSHKFYIYPSKFEQVLCTGCGRCIRHCPSGQDIIEILSVIDAATRSDAPTTSEGAQA